MPFHHPAFFGLFVLTLGVYWLGPARAQHATLLAASLAFYYYAGILDTALLLGTVGLNGVMAAALDRGTQRARRNILSVAIALNLTILGYWKYRGFIAENLSAVFPGLGLSALQPGIPLGISFYIFQLIAYQVDLARRDIPREPRAWRMLLYILFFPHHQAGPIMRPAKFLPQFYGHKVFDSRLAFEGLGWLLLGLGKKCLADAMAPVADGCFALALRGPVASFHAWRGALAFGFQIYGDFSGYSDIAVGLGLLLGYRLDANFRTPYLSGDPSEFWRRWHITLSAWLRDYLYIPLGGNRFGTLHTYKNLMLTMLLGGLWHGASWMFILWGALHGALLALHRALPGVFKPRALGLALTFLAVTVTWVPFRASTLSQTGRILGAMFYFGRGPGDTLREWALQLGSTLCLLGVYALESAARGPLGLRLWAALAAPLRGLVLASAITAILLSLSSQSTYVYFRF